MKRLRTALWITLLVAPLIWVSSWGASRSNAEGLDDALSALLLAALPLLIAALLWQEDLHPQGALIRYGQSRRGPVIKALSKTLLVAMIVSLVSVSITLVAIRGYSDPLLLRDLTATASLTFAAVLSTFFLFAAGRAWLGRTALVLLLLLSWLAGQSGHSLRLALPSGHVHSLLGIGPELPFSGALSFALLYHAALLFALLFLSKIRP